MFDSICVFGSGLISRFFPSRKYIVLYRLSKRRLPGPGLILKDDAIMFALFFSWDWEPAPRSTCPAVLLPLSTSPHFSSAHQLCRLIRRCAFGACQLFVQRQSALCIVCFYHLGSSSCHAFGSLAACQVQPCPGFFPFARYINRNRGRLTDMQLLLGPILRILGGTECGLEPTLPTRVLDHAR